ncbi:hypothetical protein, partial [Priestia megaterium]|uniref:hypothetical protein n=1 Tax=Priestia megaterium TaxID=1404 RepID=UPI0012B744B8
MDIRWKMEGKRGKKEVVVSDERLREMESGNMCCWIGYKKITRGGGRIDEMRGNISVKCEGIYREDEGGVLIG